MGILSELHRPRIRIKLMGIVLLVSSTILLLGGIMYVALSKVSTLSTTLVERHMTQVVDRASAMRGLSSIFSSIALVNRTFQGRDDILSLEGEPLIGELSALANSKTNEPLRGSLYRLTYQMDVFLGACRSMNTYLRMRTDIEQKTHHDMDELEQWISRAIIEEMQRGRESPYLEQMLVLVTGYRESLLQIDKMSRSLPSVYLREESERWVAPIVNAIDDLLLRLKTISASSQEAKVYGKEIVADVSRYRESISKLTEAMARVDNAFGELNTTRKSLLDILQDEDRQTEVESSTVGGEIGGIIQRAQLAMLAVLAVLFILATSLTYHFVTRHIEEPLRSIVQRIGKIRSEGFPDSSDMSKAEEWCTIEIAIRDMWTELALALSQLRDSEVRLSTLVQTIPDLIWLKNPEGVFLACNPVFSHLLGAEEAEIIGKTDYDFLDAELADFFRQKDREAAAAGRPTSNEEWLTFASDGHRALVETIKTPMFDDEGQLIGVLGVARDITALRASEQRFRDISYTVAWVWEMDASGRYSFVSENVQAFLGYSAEELLGQTPYNLMTSEGIKTFTERFDRMNESKQGFVDYENSVCHKDGSVRYVLTSCIPVLDSEGQLIGYRGTEKDVTVRKLAEEALRESEQRFRDISEASGEFLWEVDIGGYFTYVSERVEAILGYRPEGMIGRRPPDFMEPTEAGRTEALWRERSEMKMGFRESEHHVLARSGGTVWLSITAVVILGPTGELLGFRGAALDITERKQIEEELRRSEENYRLVVENAGEAIIIAQNGMLKFVNNRTVELFGLPKEQLTSRPFVEFLHPEDRKLVLDSHFRRLSGEGAHPVYPFRVVTKDGAVRWAELRATIVPWEGNPATLNFLNDITERKEAEELRRQSEIRYRNLVESSNDWVWEVDFSGAYTYASPHCRELLGYEPEELIGKKPFDLMPPGEARRMQKYFHEIVVKQRPFHGLENTNLHKDGYLVVLETNGVPLFDEEHNLRGYHGINRNITDRKQAEEALRKAEEKYRSIFENAMEGIFQATPEGGYLSVNPAFAKMCGFDMPEAMITAITDLETQLFANPEDQKRVKALYDSAGVVNGFETQFRRTDGKLIWISMNSRSVRDHQGLTLYYEGIIEDITERKQAEEERSRVEAQLRQAQKMESLGTLAGGIAHDFNNILGIITGYSELAQMIAGEASPVKEKLKQVSTAAARATDLVRQILAFSRMDAQEKKPVQVGLIVKEALKMLRASIPTTIEINPQVTSKAVVLADPTQIHQVLLNLCTNAAHAMRDEGGVLEVNLTDVCLPEESSFLHLGLKAGRYLELDIKDTGHGIEPSILDRIFDPFFTTKEKGVGTGLGLSVVHGIVKSHGGGIKVASLPGEGTTFSVFFPVVESDSKQREAHAAQLPRGNERILVVDDEPALAMITKEMLEQLGYEVDYRLSGPEALGLFQSGLLEKPFDLVITDMTMPRMTGTELAREIFSLQPDFPIILCTGFSEKVDAQKVKSLGIQGFLLKPVVPMQLAEMVRKLLEKRKSLPFSY